MVHMVHSSKPNGVKEGGIDWLGILEGDEEPHKMANGKTRWVYHSRPEGEREDALKEDSFVALSSRNTTKLEFSS